jgi:nitrogen fixation protein NifU and related proteins
MNPGLLELYQQIIIDHSRHPRNFGRLAGAQQADGDNPLCGDRVTVYVHLSGGAVVASAFEGAGCAICIASASLMTESVRSRTIAEVEALGERVRELVTAKPESPLDDRDPLSPLAGVRRFPIRAKCALLPWQALRAAVHEDHGVASTE